ncbi:hypothetical protein ACFWFI_02900 [Streptomyces sp. NPDC060209]|uniref:hypothetical protein n=1 Tax=Streptomyces sp. NPDC060209 TaxID=3347073 RepID=UPI00365E4DEF
MAHRLDVEGDALQRRSDSSVLRTAPVGRATAVRAAKKCQALIKAKGEGGAPVSFGWDTTTTSLSLRGSAPPMTSPAPRG